MDLKKIIKSKVCGSLAVLALVAASIFALSSSADKCGCEDCKCCAGCTANGSCDCGVCDCCGNCNATSKASTCCPGCDQ